MSPVARSRAAGSSRARRPRTDSVFRALADPTRREILSLLRERPRSVGEISLGFPMSRPAISKHLRLLREAGLVADRPQGTAVIYELNAEPLQHVDAWLTDYKRYWTHSLERLKAHVEKGK